MTTQFIYIADGATTAYVPNEPGLYTLVQEGMELETIEVGPTRFWHLLLPSYWRTPKWDGPAPGEWPIDLDNCRGHEVPHDPRAEP